MLKRMKSDKPTQQQKKEAEKNNEAARLWISEASARRGGSRSNWDWPVPPIGGSLAAARSREVP